MVQRGEREGVGGISLHTRALGVATRAAAVKAGEGKNKDDGEREDRLRRREGRGGDQVVRMKRYGVVIGVMVGKRVSSSKSG